MKRKTVTCFIMVILSNVATNNIAYAAEGDQFCTNEACEPVWTEWSDCSVTCGQGIEIRNCDENCWMTENKTDTKRCFMPPCPVWSDWSLCSASCGHGRTSRDCLEYCRPDQPKRESQHCQVQACSTEPVWSTWSRCSSHNTCRWGSQYRTCFKNCQNKKMEQKPCILNLCSDDCIERDIYYEGYDLYSERNTPKTPTAEKCQYICSITPDCKYFSFMKDKKICWLMKNLSKKSSYTGVADSGPKQCPLTPIVWSEWSPCSKTCGKGQQTRNCINCPKTYWIEDKRDCTGKPCQTVWKVWSEWSQCSVTCGTGIKRRVCLSCPQQTEESAPCHKNQCLPIWKVWSDWSQCSVTCGTGIKRRVCLSCPQQTVESAPCHENQCLQIWSEWSQCSVTCGTGIKKRFCHNCPQTKEESRPCHENQCPTIWSEWNECSVSCDTGIQSRTCLNCPKDQPKTDKQMCFEKACPPECFEEDVKYVGGEIQVVSNISSHLMCQDLCKATHECLLFTYGVTAMDCQLKSVMGERQITFDEVISGPSDCNETTILKHQRRIALNEFSRMSNSLASKLFFEVVKEVPNNDNIFFSPFSILSLLSMIMAGTNGDTREQIKDLLDFDNNFNITLGYNEATAAMAKKENLSLALANGLFARQGFQFLEDFTKELEEKFKAEVKTVDFRQAENASLFLNNWVREKTQGQLGDIFSPDQMNSVVSLILINALYFKGAWDKQFNPNHTRNEVFYLRNGRTMKKDLMKMTGQFRIAKLESLNATALEIPYAGNQMSFIIILPQDGSNGALHKVEMGLKDFDFSSIQFELPSAYDVTVPKFRMESKMDLKEMLRNLGLEDIFEESKADFSRMTKTPSLFVSEIFQKSLIEVDEEGSEASAATAATILRKSSNPQFKCNRPFIFIIKDELSGLVLFVGRLINPTTAETS